MLSHPATRAARLRTSLVLAAVLIALPTAAQAAAMFFAGRMEEGRFVPDKNVQGPAFQVRYSSTNVTIDGRQATSQVEETIDGHAAAAENVLCVIPLPKGSGVIHKTEFDPLFNWSGQMRFLPPEEAQKLYEALAEGTGNVGIVALSGKPALVSSQFPTGWLDRKVTVRYSFRRPVQERAGIFELVCPMPATMAAKGPVSRVSVSVSVKDELPLRAMFSPTHDVTVLREDLHRTVVRYKADNWSGQDDFRLLWVADADDLGLRVLAHREEGDDEGYFMLVGNPTGSAEQQKAIDKDVTFVLDTSGSMRGEKIEQARAAIDYCLGQLNSGDRFNIITFGTEVTSFGDALAGKSDANLAAAQAFIENVVARGRTNIGGALAKALAGKPEQGRPRIAIFLTDGTPTAGELVPEKIVEGVQGGNPSATRIFVMGVGHDVNAHLLDKLAEVTDGSSEYVTPEEEIDAKVAALYDRLSYPVLTSVKLAFGKLNTHSVYPEKLPVLFKGSEIMVFGRYRGGGKHRVTISGTLAGKPVEYACKADLPEKPAGAADDFVAPLWAARKIGYLLQEIRLHGEEEELIGEIVRLSKKFGIVTEYTEFLAFAGEMSTEAAVNEARRQMQMANTQQAGRWAVNQARNDSNLQNRMVAGAEANTYLDRRGNVVANDNISQVGRRVFYLREGQWVDGEEAGDRTTRVVKLFSPEYFGLLRNNPDFARSQQLGWAVSTNVGDERIVVEKDGATQSEELLQRQEQQQEMFQQQRPVQQGVNRFQNQIQIQNQIQQMPRNLRNLNQLPLQQIPQNEPLNQRIPVDNLNAVPPQVDEAPER